MIDFISSIYEGVFACATDGCVEIFHTTPRLLTRLNVSEFGSVVLCEILRSTNLLAIVSGGTDAKFPPNEAYIYDFSKKKFVKKCTVSGPILSLRFVADRLFMIQQDEVAYFRIDDATGKLHRIYTSYNPKGLCAMSQLSLPEKKVLALPEENGRVIIHELDWITTMNFISPSTIQAHSSNVAQLSVNNQGDMVATASMKGTLIRVFHTSTKQKLYEFRRGSSYASIYCLEFSGNSRYLCTSSNTGTVHVFSLKSDNSSARSTSRSWFGFTELVGIKSFASFSVPIEYKSKCSFGSGQYIYVLSYNGSIYKYKVNEEEDSYLENLTFFSNCETEEEEWFDAPNKFQ